MLPPDNINITKNEFNFYHQFLITISVILEM